MEELIRFGLAKSYIKIYIGNTKIENSLKEVYEEV
jgi:hypothetical protein